MLTSLLVLVLAVELGLPLLLAMARDRLIFLPSERPTPREGLALAGGRAQIDLVTVRRADGRELAAYDARPLTGGGDDEPVVLFLHGNGANIGARVPVLEDFVAGTGLRTLMIDYSGYGGNPGSPSEEEVYQDGVAAFDWLTEHGVEPRRIVLYGESLGAAVALAVAERRAPSGIVAQSPFASLSSMAFELYPWLPLGGLLVRGAFPSDRRASRLQAELLIVHGTRDRIVPFRQGERLHRAAPPGTELLAIEGAGHNDLFAVAGEPYLRRIGERLRRWVENAAPRRTPLTRPSETPA